VREIFLAESWVLLFAFWGLSPWLMVFRVLFDAVLWCVSTYFVVRFDVLGVTAGAVVLREREFRW